MRRFLGIASAAALVACAVCVVLGWAGTAKARDAGEAVLLTAFGTSVDRARVSYAAIERLVRERHPGVRLAWAYTSHGLHEKGAAPARALQALRDQGVLRVAVQPLHLIPGAEYHDLVAGVGGVSGVEVVVGAPLMGGSPDIAELAGALAGAVAGREPGQAVVWLGHGTHHGADAFYAALQYHLWRRDRLSFVGTVEGALDCEAVLAALRDSGARKVGLAPLMCVAGEHAANDMAGPGPDSWKSRLAAEGFEVETAMVGLGEREEVAAIWVDHLDAALAGLRSGPGE
jgi:sirohydrochlorin cobaltochelatase